MAEFLVLLDGTGMHKLELRIIVPGSSSKMNWECVMKRALHHKSLRALQRLQGYGAIFLHTVYSAILLLSCERLKTKGLIVFEPICYQNCGLQMILRLGVVVMIHMQKRLSNKDEVHSSWHIRFTERFGFSSWRSFLSKSLLQSLILCQYF